MLESVGLETITIGEWVLKGFVAVLVWLAKRAHDRLEKLEQQHVRREEFTSHREETTRFRSELREDVKGLNNKIDEILHLMARRGGRDD